MLETFVKHLPIRIKFRRLVILQSLISVIALLILFVSGSSLSAIAGTAAVLFAGVAILAWAAEAICRPYVDTVLRMEALAAGDTASPIQYTDHRDCVGRMTAAMSTFRQNNVDLQARMASDEKVVHELRAAMNSLAARNLEHRITAEFPGGYGSLKADFNSAIEVLSSTIAAVSNAAGSVATGAGERRSRRGSFPPTPSLATKRSTA